MSTITPGTPLHSFVEVFRKTLSDVLAQDLASPWNVATQAEGAPQSGGATKLCFGITLSGGLRGNAAFEIENAEALLLAQKLLAESPDPAAKLTVARKQAVEQLLRKVTALAAADLKEQFGEVDLQLASIEVPNWTGTRVALLAEEASTGKVSVELLLDKELVAGVAPSPDANSTVPASTGKPPGKAAGENNLDLLLGVELNLTLRFGQRTLTLREILDLSSGSIIELDRQVQEPADLLLGDRLIARGEVVVVDGNYGLRIKQMCDPPTTADKIGLTAAR